MQFLKANTSVKVVIGPFVDVTDGFTPETGITLGTADEAELIKHDSATTTDISARTWAAITGPDGYYNLTLTTGDTDTEGMLTIVVQDDSACLPVRATFMVLAQAAYDSMFTAKDTGYMDVNVKAVSEDTAAADNLELACDNYSATRGLSGTALPAAAAGAAGGIPTDSTGKTDFNDPTAATIADSVWDEATAGHVGAGSTGAALGDILADTNELQTDDIPGLIGSPSVSLAADLAVVDGNVDSILTDTGTTLPATLSGMETKIDTVDTNVDAILVDTAEIGVAGAGLTEAGGTGDHLTAIPETDVNVTKISGSAAAADNLEASATTIVVDTVNGAGGTTTSVPGGGTASLDATNDHYNGRIIIFTSGVLQNQATDITDYDGATTTFTVTALTEAPGNGDSFVIV